MIGQNDWQDEFDQSSLQSGQTLSMDSPVSVQFFVFFY